MQRLLYQILPRFRHLLPLAMGLGCAYRFTNLHRFAPDKARSVAVQAVFDTAGLEGCAHRLRHGLTAVFARDGRLRVSDAGADLMVHVHVFEAKRQPTDIHEEAQGPSMPVNAQGQDPYGLPALGVATRYGKAEELAVRVKVQVLDQRQGRALLTQEYGLKEDYVLYEARVPGEALGQRAWEIRGWAVDRMGLNLGERVLEDLLSLWEKGAWDEAGVLPSATW